jgi:hypothetical protein
MKRRWMVGFLLGLSAMLFVVMPASAGVMWCRTDPVVSLNYKQVQVLVAVPDQYKDAVSGPVQVQIDVPSVVRTRLISTDSGYNGYGEKVTFTTNNGSLMPDKSFYSTVVVQVPMNGVYTSVQVQVDVVTPDGVHHIFNGTQWNVNGTLVIK